MVSDVILLARILEHIPGSVIVTSLEGNIRYIDPRSEEHLGYRRSELLSAAMDSIIIDVKNEGSWNYIKNFIIERGEAFLGEIHLLKKDKNVIICNASGFCVRDEKNLPEKIVLIFEDITREKNIAEELERKNIEMARINTELIRSNQELKHASELKTKFLSIASHELKTPLTSIKGYAEIIIDNMREKVEPTIYRMIESINRAADRLHDVINNMLDVARIEQKRLKLKPEQMSLQATVSECIEELSQFVSKRNIEFNCDFAKNLPLFFGDKMRMHQVFINLFTNAIKYSPDNSQVEIKIFVDSENRFHIIVKDRGIGIDIDKLDKVFDPFYEVTNTMRHHTSNIKFLGGGTGLGLSIVKGVVERHNGIIWAESSGTIEGTYPGCEFHILLPVQPNLLQDDDETRLIKLRAQDAPPQSFFAQPSGASSKPVILIIDDDVEAIEIARMVLQNHFTILTALTGEEGLQIAFSQRPSVVLLDQYLPVLDGCRICKILRSQEETRDIPISFFTAATQYNEIEQCFTSGADDFIVKPFSSKELIDKVMRLLSLDQKERLES